MRIKLRLYPRDLDLLVLKQMSDFGLGDVIRQALYEYVEFGECKRIHVNFDPETPVTLCHDQINVSLTKDKYQKVAEWLTSIRPGLRNCAIKAIIRSAIATPALFIFAENSNLIMNDARMAKAVQNGPNTKKTEQTAAPNTPFGSPTSPFAPPIPTSPWSNINKQANTGVTDDGDIWSMDIENY